MSGVRRAAPPCPRRVTRGSARHVQPAPDQSATSSTDRALPMHSAALGASPPQQDRLSPLASVARAVSAAAMHERSSVVRPQ
eukprot:scaffold13855_cov131-Isochrysis_galbana.AAC.4